MEESMGRDWRRPFGKLLAANWKIRSRPFATPQLARVNAQIGAALHANFRVYVRWLTNALWLGFLLFSLSLFVETLPARYLNLRDEARMVSAVLDQLHVDVDLLPGYIMTFDGLTLATYVIVGILIFWRKRLGWVSFFSSLTLIIAGTAIVRPADALFFADPRLRIPLLLLFTFGSSSIYVLLYTFPDGHFVPRWTVWLGLISAANVAGTYLEPVLGGAPLRWPPTPISPAVFIPIGLGAAVQILRYHRHSTDQQQEQTRWIIYGLTIAAAGLLSYRVLVPALRPEVLEPGLDRLLYIVVGIPLVYSCLVLFPLTIAISILFHRLWDIDLLINRTLVYGSLTAILAGVYAASITLFQRLFVAMTGQQSDAAVIVSTLILAAAFTPLKDHLQIVINKHWKETHDGAKTLNLLAEEIESRISLVERDHITRRLLAEAVTGFNAKGGAVFWEQDGALKLIHSEDEWDGEAQATADIASGETSPRQGVVALGARRKGIEYTERDCQVLEHIAAVVARAIEQDRQYA